MTSNWTLSDLDAKGVSYTVTGGYVTHPRPAEPQAPRRLPSASPQDIVAMAAKDWPAVRELAIDLPTPPSLNNAYVNTGGNGRAKSKALKQFYADATAALANLGKRLDAETYRAVILVTRENDRADIDGRAKFVLDVLHKCGITVDDRHCEKLSVEWRYRGPPGCSVMLSKFKKRRAA